MRQSDPNRRQFIQRTGGVALTATGATALVSTTTASADTNSQGILADGIGEGGDQWAFFQGFLSRYRSGYGSPDGAATLADRMRNEFNANSEAWISYGNWLLEEHDVNSLETTTIGVDVAITRGRWPLRSPETVETTVDATYDEDTGEFTTLEWRDGAPEDPEYTVTVENTAAEDGADELQAFRREHIDPDGDDHALPDAEYVSELAGKYSGSVLVDEQSVLELLLGEIDE